MKNAAIFPNRNKIGYEIQNMRIMWIKKKEDIFNGLSSNISRLDQVSKSEIESKHRQFNPPVVMSNLNIQYNLS